MDRTQYKSPTNGWVFGLFAQMKLAKLADKLASLGTTKGREGAKLIRRGWRAVAARPDVWADLSKYAERLNNE
jgi:hypothetical protein